MILRRCGGPISRATRHFSTAPSLRQRLLTHSHHLLSHPLTRISWDIIRVHLTILRVPFTFLRAILTPVLIPGVVYLGGCGVYSQVSPAEWALSDHNVYLTGVLRVLRTISNAALIVLVMKWSYWGVEVPEERKGRRGPPMMGPRKKKEEEEEEELSPVEKRYREVQHEFWEFTANKIASTFLANGGIYIKLGQAIATYSAMLPPEFAAALKPLLGSIFERQSGEVDHMFVKDLGAAPGELFSEFERQPIAGASIAQVFVGRTREGEKVAIKVQYHDIAKRFKMDKYTTIFLMNVLDYFQPGVEILRFIPHIFDGLEKELDFVTEGHNAEQCASDLRHLDYVVVPKVHWNLSSYRILTMDFAEGVTLVDVDRLKTEGFDLRDIMEKIVLAFSEQVFRTGNIHADPHPGNILVRPGVCGKAEIVLIDHGLYERLTPKIRQAFAAFWHSVIIEDDETVQRSGRELGLSHPDMFATMLFFKAYGSLKKMGFNMNGPGGGHKITEEMSEEQKKMMQEVREMGHEMVDSLPKELALVFRNLRLIQGINFSFGIPVNRVRMMAEVAVRYSTKETDLWTAVKLRLKFEWHFFYLDVRNRLLAWAAWLYSLWTRNRKQHQDMPDITQAVAMLRA